MDFELSGEQQMARQLFRDFANAEVKPLAHEVDEEERFPDETVQKLKRYGFLGIPFEKKYGGQGADTLAYALCVEEISRVCASTGAIIAAHTSLACQPVKRHGTPEQKKSYLQAMLRGDLLGAFAFTEKTTGIDPAGMQATANAEGEHYLLNGVKTYVTNGGKADVYIVFAMTDQSKGARGISAFIVEKGFPGFFVGEKTGMMGIRGAAMTELRLENCRVPKENLLGKEGKGLGIAMHALDDGRIAIAAQALGIAQGALDETVRYVKERKQFNKPLSSFQNTQFVLAEMKAKVDAARLLVYRAAFARDKQKQYTEEAAVAKLFAANVAMEVTTGCLQLYGGYGYMRDYPLERMMRDAKSTEIHEGTNELQKMAISSAMLK